MNEKLFSWGYGCAVAGLLLARLAQHDGREPTWAIPILFFLLVGWAILTALSVIRKTPR